MARFVTGEHFEEAYRVLVHLKNIGIQGILDHLGEDVSNESEAINATKDYCYALDKMTELGEKAVISIKLTQLGLSFNENLCEKNVTEILNTAHNQHFVEIDMEDSSHADATLKIFKKMMNSYNNIGLALQAYLYRTEKDLQELVVHAKKLNKKVKIRLVKGAYDEPSSIAFQHNSDVNKNYMKLTKYIFNHSELFPAIATHNTQLINYARKLCELELNNAKDKFEFQMLLGIRKKLQINLIRQGYGLKVYVPYGDSWFPYFMRRIGERPANGIFLIKQLFPWR